MCLVWGVKRPTSATLPIWRAPSAGRSPKINLSPLIKKCAKKCLDLNSSVLAAKLFCLLIKKEMAQDSTLTFVMSN